MTIYAMCRYAYANKYKYICIYIYRESEICASVMYRTPMSKQGLATTCVHCSSTFAGTLRKYAPTSSIVFPTTLCKVLSRRDRRDATARKFLNGPVFQSKRRAVVLQGTFGSSKNRGRAKRGPKILVLVYIYIYM